MKKYAFSLCLALAVVSASAHAEDILNAREDCKYLAIYQPDPVNDAEYKPGVDAEGNPVVEADIAPSAITLPDKYTFDIKVDAATNAGLPVPAGVISEMSVGSVTIEKGRVSFNGKPIEGDAEATLRALCASTPPPETKQPQKKQK